MSEFDQLHSKPEIVSLDVNASTPTDLSNPVAGDVKPDLLALDRDSIAEILKNVGVSD